METASLYILGIIALGVVIWWAYHHISFSDYKIEVWEELQQLQVTNPADIVRVFENEIRTHWRLKTPAYVVADSLRQIGRTWIRKEDIK